MATTRIGTMAVRWILESPRAREELRLVEPMLAIMAAVRLLDVSFEEMLDQDPDVANAIADLVEAFYDRIAGLRDSAM